MENIENNISRIEETSIALPDLEKKIKFLKEDYNQKLEIISYCTEYLETQFSRAQDTIYRIL